MKSSYVICVLYWLAVSASNLIEADYYMNTPAKRSQQWNRLYVWDWIHRIDLVTFVFSAFGRSIHTSPLANSRKRGLGSHHYLHQGVGQCKFEDRMHSRIAPSEFWPCNFIATSGRKLAFLTLTFATSTLTLVILTLDDIFCNFSPKCCRDLLRNNRAILSRASEGWGLLQTTQAPGSNKTRGQGSFPVRSQVES